MSNIIDKITVFDLRPSIEIVSLSRYIIF